METVGNELPVSLRWMFPEYDFRDIGLDSHRDVIIERVLDRGNWDQLRWLFRTYNEKTVADWVRNHGYRLLSKRSFALWCVALGLKEFKAPDWAIEAKEDRW
jgi:hypothetical protein